MISKLPHLQFGSRFSDDELQGFSNWELEKKRNDLWNLIEGYEDKTKISRQPVVKMTYELDLFDANEMMKQLQAEIERRKSISK